MNKWRVQYIELDSVIGTDNIIAKVQRLWQPHLAGYKERRYIPTPSSLARLVRVMQGKPMQPVPETCKWIWYKNSNWKCGCGEIYIDAVYLDLIFCPYCGCKIEVVS